MSFASTPLGNPIEKSAVCIRLDFPEIYKNYIREGIK